MARPPTEIILSYDLEKKNFHVEARRVTKDPRKHFIRQIVVYKNNMEARKCFYVQQTSASMLSRMPLWKRSPGDVPRVEAVCNEVGREEVTFVIP